MCEHYVLTNIFQISNIFIVGYIDLYLYSYPSQHIIWQVLSEQYNEVFANFHSNLKDHVMAEAKASSSNETFTMKVVLSGIKKRFSEVPNTSPSEVQKIIDDASVDDKRRFLIFDVREEKEFNISHISQANFIDEKLPSQEKVDKVADIIKDKLGDYRPTLEQPVNIFIYCSIGYRSSALVSSIFKSSRFEELSQYNLKFYNVEGGLFQWANERRPLVNHAQVKTDVVHPYNALWGRLLQKKHRYEGK